MNSLMEPLQGKNTFGMGTVLVGEIRLRNSDPFSKPIIDPHYLEHPANVQALREGTTKISDKFINDNALRFNLNLSF